MNEQKAFLPVFGHKPQQMVGREQAVTDFVEGLAAAPESRWRTTLITSQKGMGKTALIHELAGWAEAEGYTALHVSPTSDSFPQLMQLAQDRPVAVFIDDVTSPTASLRYLAQGYRQLCAQGKDVAMVLSGHPVQIESMLQDSVLSTLRFAHNVRLGALGDGAVQSALFSGLMQSGRLLEDDELQRASIAISGHPYMLQLMGSYLEDGSLPVDRALNFARADFISNLLDPMLANLSSKDMEVLQALAQLGGTARIGAIRGIMGVADNYLQPYRARLLKAGVVVSPRRGELTFALPHLAEAVRE